jgi:hypothetical protein
MGVFTLLLKVLFIWAMLELVVYHIVVVRYPNEQNFFEYYWWDHRQAHGGFRATAVANSTVGS